MLTGCSWSHADLTELDDAGIASEMGQLEVAFQDIIGKIPTYMRPVSRRNLCIEQD
jgi:hypothetical protein